MNLELVTVQRGGRSKYAPAFDEHDGFTEHWWNRPMGDDPQYRFIQVLSDGVEVARVELDEKVYTAHYDGAPDLGDVALEIQFIEVSDNYRRQGIGAAVVHRLAELHPDRRLVAYSEEADDFWSKLGWHPYYHPEERGPSVAHAVHPARLAAERLSVTRVSQLSRNLCAIKPPAAVYNGSHH